MNSRTSILCIALATVGACSSSTESQVDPRLCLQTYEFGNTGCFEIAATVVGLRGQPLSGMIVGNRGGAVGGHAGFASTFKMSDSNGRATIRAARMLGDPPANGAPDTVSVYLVASDPSSSTVGVSVTVRDSVLVRVPVAAVGSAPQSTEARIALKSP